MACNHTTDSRRPLTVAELAEAKKLNVGFLRAQLSWRDSVEGIEIPFFDYDGVEVGVKLRTHLVAKLGSRWGRGKHVVPYGRNKLALARKHGTLFLVEGETDTATLLQHDFGALGLPGADCAGCLSKEDIAGVLDIVLVIEPDAGGARFLFGLLNRLVELGYTGQVRVLRMKPECKDVSDLYIHDPPAFPGRLKELLATAEVVTGPQGPGLPAGPAGATRPQGAVAPALVAGPSGRGILANSATADDAEEAVVVPISEIAAEPLVWLWEKRIPLGMTTLLEGDPGTGKSCIQLGLAARVSRGEPMPFETIGRPAAKVLLLATEDDVARTTRGRLEVAGADITRIRFCHGLRGKGGRMRLPSFPHDLEWLGNEIVTHNIALVLIDPLSAYIARDLNPNSEVDMRLLFGELQRLCRDTGATLLPLRHLNKVEGTNSLYRGSGSVGIIASVRSGLVTAPDPTRPGERLFILAVNKCNLAEPARSLRFRIVPVGDHCRVEYLEEVDLTAQQLFAAQRSKADREPGRGESAEDLAFAIDFLKEVLDGGPLLVKELKEQAVAEGLEWPLITKARKALPIEVRKENFGGAYRWHLIKLSPDMLNGKDEPMSA